MSALLFLWVPQEVLVRIRGSRDWPEVGEAHRCAARDFLFPEQKVRSGRELVEEMEIPDVSPQGFFPRRSCFAPPLDPAVQVKARQQLALAWGREILWRRSAAAAPEIRETLAAQLLAKPLEQVLADNWNWYEPMMFTRRLRRVLGYPSNFPQFFHSK